MPEPVFGAPTHGGPDASGPVPHDFSTNANACGPCPLVRRLLRQVDATHYPDPASTRLRQSLAGFHAVDASRVWIAASASEFIFRISAAIALRRGPEARVWMPAPSYGDYRRAASAFKLQDASMPLPVGQDAGSPSTAAADLVWCCDPSSPLGQPQAGLAAMIDGLSAQACCVLDQAYEPLRLSGNLGLTPGQLNRCWRLYTPNKALGLTGIRAAYAIAPAQVPPDLQTQLHRLAPSWPIGRHGEVLLQAWTLPEVQAWLAQSLERLRRWKRAQLALCESFGWHCLPSDANFFCARVHDGRPPRLRDLRQAGIRLRDASDFDWPGTFRLAVLPPASQTALKQAMRRQGA